MNIKRLEGSLLPLDKQRIREGFYFFLLYIPNSFDNFLTNDTHPLNKKKKNHSLKKTGIESASKAMFPAGPKLAISRLALETHQQQAIYTDTRLISSRIISVSP